MTYTLTESGLVLTETQDGVTMPADYSFATVNDYVHSFGTQYEELQCLALGMACHIDKLTKQLDELLAAIENLHKVKGRYHTEQAFQALMATYDRVKGGAA